MHESVKAEVDCSLSVTYKEDLFQLYLKDKEGMCSGLWTKSTSGMKRMGTKSSNEAWMCRNGHKDKLEDQKLAR